MHLTASDFWRAVNLLICLTCVIILANRFRKNRQQWNAKTRDYWLSFMMWSVAGLEFSIQGIIESTALNYRLVFISAAALVTLSGLRRKGAWGTDNDR
jgi:hypothetical protein